MFEFESFTTSVISTLPSEWLPLFKCLCKSVEIGELWYREQTTSQYTRPPLWHNLISSVLTSDPTIVDGALAFKPKFMLLPSNVQERFMKFLLSQSSTVGDAVVKELLLGIVKYVKEQGNSELLHLIQTLSRKAKCEELLFTSDEPSIEKVENFDLDEEAGSQDVIIIVEDCSDDGEPAMKRPRLDESSLKDPVETKNPGAISVTKNSDEVFKGVMDAKKNGEDDSNISQISCSQRTTVSFVDEKEESDSDPTTTETSDMSVFNPVKDAWHNCLTNNSSGVLQDLVKLSQSDMEQFCEFVDFENMDEESVEFACNQLATLSDLLSYRNVTVFLKYCLESRVLALVQTASRRLIGTLNCIGQVYAKPLIDSVILSCFNLDEISCGQIEALCRVVKDTFNNSTRGYLMHNLLQSGLQISNASKLQVLYTVLENGCDLTEQDRVKLSAALLTASSEMCKNLVFSKFLLLLVNEYPEFVKEHRSQFQCVLDKHNTFLKRKISTLVNKLK